MSSQNRNRQLPRTSEEKNVIDAAHRGARRGSLIGAVAGGLAGAAIGRKPRLATLGGVAAGAVTGDQIGRRLGTAAGARDVREARKALKMNRQLAEIHELSGHLDDMVAHATARDFDRLGNEMEPNAFPQARPVDRPGVRGKPSEPGNGVSSEARFAILRDKLTSVYGWGVTSSLDDDELTVENCKRLREEVLSRQARTDSPSAGVRRGEDFERATLVQHLGARAVEAMSAAEVHCHYLSAQRRGLIELEDQGEPINFALINRTRNNEGEFTDENAVSSQAVQRAYHPRERKTGISAPMAAGTTAAGLLSVAGYLRGRKRRSPRLPLGVPKLASDSTAFAMGSPGSYIIRRANLRGKKPPTGIRPVHVGKAKPKRHSLAFLIQDDDFPLVPQRAQKLPPGMKRRVPLARTRAEILKRLRGITALSRRDFGTGSLAAGLIDGAIDAASMGGLAGETPSQRRARQQRIATQQANAARDQASADDPDASPRTLDSALERLANLDFSLGSAAASGVARDVGVIAGADLSAEELHDLIQQARERKRKKAALQVRGGIEQTPGMAGAPTTMSSILGVVHEFEYGDERVARAKRRGEAIGAAGAGGAAGALAGAYHDQGEPVSARDLRPGDQVYRRKGPFGVYQHSGVVDETGKRIVHRTKGSSVARSVTPETFVRGGRGPLRREAHGSDLPRARAARNATSAAGTRQGKYSIVGENCQHATSRIASKGAPVSRQLRKVIGGAAIGAIGAGSVASILKRKKAPNGKR